MKGDLDIASEARATARSSGRWTAATCSSPTCASSRSSTRPACACCCRRTCSATERGCASASARRRHGARLLEVTRINDRFPVVDDPAELTAVSNRGGRGARPRPCASLRARRGAARRGPACPSGRPRGRRCGPGGAARRRGRARRAPRGRPGGRRAARGPGGRRPSRRATAAARTRSSRGGEVTALTSRTGVAASRTQAWKTGSPGLRPSAFSQQTADHFIVCPSSRRGGESASRTASAPPTRSTAATSRACTRAERVRLVDGLGLGAGRERERRPRRRRREPRPRRAAAPSAAARRRLGSGRAGVDGCTGAVSPLRTSVSRE